MTFQSYVLVDLQSTLPVALFRRKTDFIPRAEGHRGHEYRLVLGGVLVAVAAERAF